MQVRFSGEPRVLREPQGFLSLKLKKAAGFYDLFDPHTCLAIVCPRRTGGGVVSRHRALWAGSFINLYMYLHILN
jgi:hypothetical protein